METVKLFDAEWNLMEIVWETAPTTASRIAGIAGQRFGWAKNTNLHGAQAAESARAFWSAAGPTLR